MTDNKIIIEKETGDKLLEFHDTLMEHIHNINEKYQLNYYELVGVLDTIKFILHDDAINSPEEED